MEKTIGCVVMAAGNARRFGENKLMAALDGRTLIERALDAVPASLFSDVVVVTQFDGIAALAEGRGFRCVRNERPEDGLSRTVRLGVEALRHCDGILFMVSDQPLLSRGAVVRVAERWREQPERIVGLGHEGKRGNPCLFPREFFPELRKLEGDQGGSAVIRAHPEKLLLVETDREELTDVDTKTALDALKETGG